MPRPTLWERSTKLRNTSWERINKLREKFRAWLAKYPLLDKFVYYCYGAVFSPAFVVVYALYYTVEALEWVAKCITTSFRWSEKRWQERVLLKPHELARRQQEREVRYAVRAFPRKRKRRLTLGERQMPILDDLEVRPSSCVVGSFQEQCDQAKRQRKRRRGTEVPVVEQQTIDQLGKSHFWRFPFEVRERIWKYAVGAHHIHIVRRRGRLGNVYCPADDPTDPLRRDLCLHTRDEHGFYRPTAWPVDVRLLSLLLSCRQIYSECVDFVYALNTFAFDDTAVMETFLTHLLPYRKYLIAHMHFSPNLSNDNPNLYTDTSALSIRGYTVQLYAPKPGLRYLWPLPNLRSFTVVPGYDRIRPEPCGSTTLVDSIRFYVRELATIEVDGLFTLAWPEAEDRYRTFFPTGWWGHDGLIPADRNFTLRGVPTRFPVNLLAFSFPFHVQCLHCASYTIIRKTTTGFAEACYYKRQEGGLVPTGRTSPGSPSLARYWTFHTLCGGWIELEYEYSSKAWSATQGARAISDEEAEAHLARPGVSYPRVLGTAHEILQDIDRRAINTVGWVSLDLAGRLYDSPTREAFYRNAGWG